MTETLEQKIDRLAGDGFYLQLQLRGSDDVAAFPFPRIPRNGEVIAGGDGKFKALEILRRRGDREVFMSAIQLPLETPTTEEGDSNIAARTSFVSGDPRLSPPSPPPEAPPTVFKFRYDVRHKDQCTYGPRPTQLFCVTAIGTSRAVISEKVAEMMVDVPPELTELADWLSRELADAELTDAERLHLAITIDEHLGRKGFDTEVGEPYEIRRVDAVGHGSRAPHSRRALKLLAPSLAAALDRINGTENEPIPLTKSELAAQQEADLAAQAKRERELREQTAFEELMSDAAEALKTKDRRRAAALINVVFGVPRAMPAESLARFLAREDFASDPQTDNVAEALAQS